MSKAVSYLRCASIDQSNESIERQRATIKAYCATHSINLIEEYIDIAYAGTNDRRPDFQRLISDAKKHPTWESVLVADTSRFCRNIDDATHYESILNNLGIKLVSTAPDSNNAYSMVNLLSELCNHSNSLPLTHRRPL